MRKRRTGGEKMQTIFSETMKPKKIRIDDFSVNKRYDARMDIARSVSRNITSMTNQMIRNLTINVVDSVPFEEERKKR